MKETHRLIVNTTPIALSAKHGSRLFLLGMVMNTWILLFGYSLFSKEEFLFLMAEYWIPIPCILTIVGYLITLMFAVLSWRFLCSYDKNNTELGRYIAINEKIAAPFFEIVYTTKRKEDETDQQTQSPT